MNVPIQPLRYDLPRDIDWPRLITALLDSGYTRNELGRAMGYTAEHPCTSVTRHIQGERRMQFDSGVSLLALAEGRLPERVVARCCFETGAHDHAEPPRQDAGRAVRYPVDCDVAGLVRALKERGIALNHIARQAGTVPSTLTRMMSHSGQPKLRTALRIMAYAERVLPPETFARHVTYAEPAE